LTYTATVERDGDYWLAVVDDHPGVYTQATTVHELRAHLVEVVKLILDDDVAPEELAVNVRVVVSYDATDETWYGHVAGLPEAHTYGATEAEVRANLVEVVEVWCELEPNSFGIRG
jgi:predicted RNase H-like HicB family nuclease